MSQKLEAERPARWGIKLCGRRHAYCNICRPEVGRAVSSTLLSLNLRGPCNEGTMFGSGQKYKIKKCGNAHAWCSICRPDIEFVGMKGKEITDEYRARLSQAQKKVIHTSEWNAAISRSLKRHREKECSKGCCSPVRSPTSLEYALQLLLEDAGLEYEAQKRFGRYTVDSWVPSHKLVFEADGEYWHRRKGEKRERQRDTYLIGKEPMAVIHLTEYDLDPWLEA